MDIRFKDLRMPGPFASDAKRLAWLDRLNAVAGAPNIPADKITKLPNIHCADRTRRAALSEFLGVLDWVLQEIRAS